MGENVYTFKIDKEGNWYHEGVEITHELIYSYLYSLLQRDENGLYFIETEGNKWYVEVEDAPFIVIGLKQSPDNRGLIIRLNDGTEEPLSLDSLSIKKDNVPYCKVKGGKSEARFNRPSYFSLAQYIQYDPAQDIFFLEYGGLRHYLPK